MAKGTRELKARIRGVSNIKQITRAMEMVATTKLRRLQDRAEGAFPYADSLKRLVATLADKVDPSVSPLLGVRPVERCLVVVVASERGLCGAYNNNVLRSAHAFLKERPGVTCRLRVFGRKASPFFKRRGFAIESQYRENLEKIPFRRARQIMHDLRGTFERGEVDEVMLVTTRFVSTMSQRPEVVRLLPINAMALGAETARESGARPPGVPILEPSAEEIFRRLLPKYLEVRFFAALLDAVASEFAMRRVAMKAATDAAGDMIELLTRAYNRARQEAITKELLDIIGSAEAVL
ncbi:MAG: ATP synthase F1 subunit gamma [Planctomycetota bacterium]